MMQGMKGTIRRLMAAVLAGGLMMGVSVNSFALLKPKAAMSQDWESLGLHERYTEFSSDDGAYTVQPVAVDSSAVGKALANVTAVGVTNKMVRLTYPAKIYEIEGTASKCAVAITYDSGETYFIATSRSYMPQTLGALIKDLNLKETMAIGEMQYTYWKDNTRKKGNHIVERYRLDDATQLWETVLADTTLPRDLTAPNTLVGILRIPITLENIGVDGYYLEVTMDGFLRTNVLDTGKGFFLGKKTTQSFIKYVTENGTSLGKSVLSDEIDIEQESVLGAKSVVK